MKRRFTFLLMALSALLVMPALAQNTPSSLATVSYDGISLAYDPALGAVLPQMAAEVPASSDMMPGSYWPAHIAFTFINAKEGDTMFTPDLYPQLSIYKLADIKAYKDDIFTQDLQDLDKLIATGSGDLSKYEVVAPDDTTLNLPHLPPIAAGQVIRAQAEYLPNSAGNGIRYLSFYSSDVSPMTDDRIIYTYQGETSSGYYIAFTYPIKTGVLPTELSADFDYNAFSNNYVKEMNDALQKVNTADGSTFTPTLASLDALVKSIKIDG
ncbi:MAG: hypothetical protein H0X30_01040 [Anaerolineae bacterium]|nr:hypothetical protein [Anaerolineae bacterium]